MTRSNDLALYLHRSLPDWRRAWTTGPWRDESLEYHYPHEQRPTVDQLAQTFLDDAEFRSLQLAGLVSTPTGEFFTEALEQVSPPFLRPDERLIVEALKLAVTMQQRGNRRAGAVALAAVAAAGYLLWASGSD